MLFKTNNNNVENSSLIIKKKTKNEETNTTLNFRPLWKREKEDIIKYTFVEEVGPAIEFVYQNKLSESDFSLTYLENIFMNLWPLKLIYMQSKDKNRLRQLTR